MLFYKSLLFVIATISFVYSFHAIKSIKPSFFVKRLNNDRSFTIYSEFERTEPIKKVEPIAIESVTESEEDENEKQVELSQSMKKKLIRELQSQGLCAISILKSFD